MNRVNVVLINEAPSTEGIVTLAAVPYDGDLEKHEEFNAAYDALMQKLASGLTPPCGSEPSRSGEYCTEADYKLNIGGDRVIAKLDKLKELDDLVVHREELVKLVCESALRQHRAIQDYMREPAACGQYDEACHELESVASDLEDILTLIEEVKK